MRVEGSTRDEKLLVLMTLLLTEAEAAAKTNGGSETIRPTRAS